jgi:hypothetical protein
LGHTGEFPVPRDVTVKDGRVSGPVMICGDVTLVLTVFTATPSRMVKLAFIGWFHTG